MVYVYLPAAYHHLNLDVTKDNLLAVGFSAVPAVFLDAFLFVYFFVSSLIIPGLSGPPSLSCVLSKASELGVCVYIHGDEKINYLSIDWISESIYLVYVMHI